MTQFSSLPPPPNTQPIADSKGSTSWTWQDWFLRLREKLQELTILPTLGSSNQLLGVNAAGTNLEYKTFGVQGVAGTLPTTNGGTGFASYAVGDILYASSTTALSKLADVSAGSFLRSGGVTTAPAWSTTKWTNSATTGDLLYASAANTYSNLAAVAVGQLLLSSGVGTAPSWGTFAATGDATGTYGVAGLPLTLATVNANVGSFGDSTHVGSFMVNGKGLITAASSVAIAYPSSGSGTLSRTNDTNVTMTLGGTPAGALFQSVSMTLGWSGQLGLSRGGTNADLSATGGASQVLKQATAGAAITVGQLAASDLSNGTTGSGSVVLATSPTIATAVLGSSTATTQTPKDNSTKLATTAYVDAAVLGQNYKEACKYGSTTALPTVVYSNGSSGVGATLTAAAFGALSFDGGTPSVGDRVLIKNQASTLQNGIYTVTVVGAVATLFVLTRATDFDQSTDIETGDSTFITSGSTLASTTWAVNSADTPTIGTDPITFAQAAGQGSFTAGNGISITGVSIAIDTSVTVDKTTSQTLTNKTLTSPTIAAIGNLTTNGYVKTSGGVGTLGIQAVPIPVADGGTALTSGTSGGVLGYTASGTLASSAALTANGIVLGGGAGATPTATAAMTNGQVLVGQTSSAPLPKTITGDLALSATGAVTLATVNSDLGSFGDATHVSQITVNAKGLITAAANVAITGIAPSGTAGGGLTGSYPNPTVDINSQTEDTSPDGEADYLLSYDASAAANKKILLQRATKYKAGTFTRDLSTASGSQAITGIGFKPKLILLACSISGGSAWGSFDGMSDVSTNSCFELSQNTTSPSIFIQPNFVAVIRTNAAGSNLQTVVVSSFDSDGFTLAWTKVGSPSGTGTLIFAAFR